MFSKISKPCTGKNSRGENIHLPLNTYESVCRTVLDDAFVTEGEIENCRVFVMPSASSGSFHWDCNAGNYLVIQRRTGPTVETGFSAPIVTAKNNQQIVLGVGFYPMYEEYLCLISAYNLTTVS
jgi:hypothetical protein